ncbi:MAG: porphobilinogen synthase, partial [Acidobacteriota bacterium]
MKHPYYRPRRLRENPILRRMVRETRIDVDQLIYPVFVQEGKGFKQEIASMPGQYRFSVDALVEELQEARQLGIASVILFGIPESSAKDASGQAAYDPQGIVPRALREVRRCVPDLLLMADLCLCEYTDHGHCGLVGQRADGTAFIENDPTLQSLARAAVVYAQAGAGVIAPSDMMDGR